MSGYDYGNARLRAMKSRLLLTRDLELLIDSKTVQGLIAALIKTPYRRTLELALAQTSGMDCITSALRNDLIATVEKVRQFYEDQPARLVALALRTYDIQNLKAILRGLARNVASGEILAALLPVGDLTFDVLNELSNAAGPRPAIDRMAGMGLPAAAPLLELRTERPGADSVEMELALDRWHYLEARDYLKDVNGEGSVLFTALKTDADITNLLTVLRFANEPVETRLLKERFGTPDITHLLVGPGSLSFGSLRRAAAQEMLKAALEVFAGSSYGAALRAGYQSYERSRRLSDIERQLRRYQLHQAAGWITKDPLGIGVVLGYLALKINEMGNIRWIGRGLQLELKADEIRAGLEVAG